MQLQLPATLSAITDLFQTTYTPVSGMYCLYNPNSSVLPGIQTLLFNLMAPAVVLVLLILLWTAWFRYVVWCLHGWVGGLRDVLPLLRNPIQRRLSDTFELITLRVGR